MGRKKLSKNLFEKVMVKTALFVVSKMVENPNAFDKEMKGEIENFIISRVLEECPTFEDFKYLSLGIKNIVLNNARDIAKKIKIDTELSESQLFRLIQKAKKINVVEVSSEGIIFNNSIYVILDILNDCKTFEDFNNLPPKIKSVILFTARDIAKYFCRANDTKLSEQDLFKVMLLIKRYLEKDAQIND